MKILILALSLASSPVEVQYNPYPPPGQFMAPDGAPRGYNAPIRGGGSAYFGPDGGFRGIHQPMRTRQDAEREIREREMEDYYRRRR